MKLNSKILSDHLKYQEDLEYLLKDSVHLQNLNFSYIKGFIAIDNRLYKYYMHNIKGYNLFKKKYVILNNTCQPTLRFKYIKYLFKHQKFNKNLNKISNLKFILSYFYFIIDDFIKWNFIYKFYR